MASTSGKEPIGSAEMETSPSMAIEAKLTLDNQKLKDLLNKDNATTMAMDAKLMVFTGHDECQKLKNLLNKNEATVMLVATLSKKNLQAPEAKPSLTSSQLCFLAAASEGDLQKLTRLLSRTGDVEEGNNVPAPSASAASLLKSVTLEGDTALHLVAANGSSRDSEHIERCDKFILNDKSLLYEKNNKGDTPLHCAVRAGNSELVSCLIGLAKNDGKEQVLLRMENNNKETALHEAVRMGDKEMVKVLLAADSALALFPTNGTSPLYLAILMIDDEAILRIEDKHATKDDKAILRKEGGDDLVNIVGPALNSQSLSNKNKEKSMAQTLHDESSRVANSGVEQSQTPPKADTLSYLGPNGQNALHVAVLRGPVITRKLLQWNKDLTIERDENGSTPLHFVAGLFGALRRGSVCSQVFDANPDALFQPDNNGLSPIHVAASVGAYQAVALFTKKCPSSAGLRDAKGRTFLHVAVENEQLHTLVNARGNRSLQAWIMNMKDNDGNTALHLAIMSGSLRLFCAIFANPKVHLNIENVKGHTPLDIAEYMVPPRGLSYGQNSEVLIRYALRVAGARRGASRRDHFWDSYEDIHGLKSEQKRKELEKMKDVTQTTSIAAVLIATVAFGATFALPGGYRADDHTNGGTPTLAGRYAFDGFMIANTLAFMFSAGTVLCLLYGGSPIFNRNSRIMHLGMSFRLLKYSVTCFISSFALGAFVVLSPVARKTAIAICVITPLILIFYQSDFWMKRLVLLRPLCVRKGLLWTSYMCIWVVLLNMFIELWPLLLIFIWAAYGRTHPVSKVEPPAQPPTI